MKRTVAVSVIALMILGALPIVCIEGPGDASVTCSSDGEASFLVDYGNGSTEWIPGSVEGISSAVAVGLLNSAGIEASYSDASGLVVDGIRAETVGSAATGGSLQVSGTTGVTVNVSWHFFRWDGSAWKESLPRSSSDRPLAVAYYPDGTAPVVTPEHRSAWTMIGADADNTFNTEAAVDPSPAVPLFECFPGTEDTSGVYGGVLYAQGHILVKYGWAQTAHKAMVACYDQATGELEWKFYMPDCMLETPTSLIVGDYMFIETMGRVIYRVNYLEGPGEPDADGNYPNVVSMEGKAMKDITEDDKMPKTTAEVIGKPYGYGLGSLIYSDGLIIGKANNGMFYAFDTGLHLVWSYQSGGSNYFSSVSCVDGMVFGGTLDGCLYVLNVKDGSLIAKEQVKESTQKKAVQPMTPIVFRDGGNYRIFLTWSATSMGSTTNGYGVYVFDPSAGTFESIVQVDQKDGVSSYMTAYSVGGRPAALLCTADGICSVDSDGRTTVVSDFFKGPYVVHAAFTLVNGNDLYLSTYQQGQGRENAQSIYLIHLDEPSRYYRYTPSTLQYAMAPVTVVDGIVMCGNDAGAYALRGSLDDTLHTVSFSGTGYSVSVGGREIRGGDPVGEGRTVELHATGIRQIARASYNDGTDHDITDTLSFVMPGADVTVTVEMQPDPVITFAGGGFTVAADGRAVSSGDAVPAGSAVVVTAADGYTVTKASYNDGTDHDITSDPRFEMPNASVVLTVETEKSRSGGNAVLYTAAGVIGAVAVIGAAGAFLFLRRP